MVGTAQPSPWWSPARHADRKPFLMARNAITKAVRAWFDEQGFAEVETAILQVSPGNETHLHAPRTELTSGDGTRATRYLRTSPEFAAKKLLAAGEAKIFEFARVFRDRERGDLHLPEFTMLEWYRADASYDAVMADTIVVVAHAVSNDSEATISSERICPSPGAGRARGRPLRTARAIRHACVVARLAITCDRPAPACLRWPCQPGLDAQ